MKIETIHASLVNGQRRQMADQIDEYGLYDFWSEYLIHLNQYHWDDGDPLKYFTDACISYHRIKSK